MTGDRDPDPGLVRPDRNSEEFFDPLAAVIAEALSAGGTAQDPPQTVEDARSAAELITGAVLDRFVVRPRPVERGDRQAFEHQRIMTAFTSDFRDFSPAEVYLDRGHAMIDLVFAQEDGAWYRFCADAEPRGGGPGGFIASETGPGLDDVGWTPLRDGIGSPELVHAEGPAIAPGVDGDWHLLIDEYGERGYQLYHAESLASGSWEHLGTADVPGGARHGSLLPITDDERRRLVGGSG